MKKGRKGAHRYRDGYTGRHGYTGKLQRKLEDTEGDGCVERNYDSSDTTCMHVIQHKIPA